MKEACDQAMLAVAARLLSYPSDEFRDELSEIRDMADQWIEVGPLRNAIATTVDALLELSLREAREQYVAAFDLKERTGLYLTAHELGDSRKRGASLIELRKLIFSYGYEPPSDELPDFIPLLFELLAAVPMSEELLQLKLRLSCATERIRGHTPEASRYAPLFEALMTSVFEPPNKETMQALERGREKPDLEPMPYPLMYK